MVRSLPLGAEGLRAFIPPPRSPPSFFRSAHLRLCKSFCFDMLPVKPNNYRIIITTTTTTAAAAVPAAVQTSETLHLPGYAVRSRYARLYRPVPLSLKSLRPFISSWSTFSQVVTPVYIVLVHFLSSRYARLYRPGPLSLKSLRPFISSWSTFSQVVTPVYIVLVHFLSSRYARLYRPVPLSLKSLRPFISSWSTFSQALRSRYARLYRPGPLSLKLFYKLIIQGP